MIKYFIEFSPLIPLLAPLDDEEQRLYSERPSTSTTLHRKLILTAFDHNRQFPCQGLGHLAFDCCLINLALVPYSSFCRC